MSDGSTNNRPTIGLLVPDIASEDGYNAAIWSGAVEACKQRDANLICFVGGWLPRSGDENEDPRNAIYGLVSKHNVDGLIVSGVVVGLAAPDRVKRFYDRYRPLPMVNIALAQEDIPNVMPDNYGGMRSMIAHLTQAHGHRRIAFIRGPETNPEAEQRYQAYVDVLAEYGVPFDPDLVAPGDFLAPSGESAVRLLFDERRVTFEAIVAASDAMAIGALRALQDRGIRVPYDVAVVGFDDIDEARATTPSLTTVQQPLVELGKRAAETLLALLSGKNVPAQVTVPTQLIIRQSCSCLSSMTMQAAAGSIPRTGETLEMAFGSQRERILFEMIQAADMPATGTTMGWAEQLLDAFSAELTTGATTGAANVFLPTLDVVIRQTISAGKDVASWQGALSALRRHLLPYLSESTLSRAGDLWQQARVMIGETAQRTEMNRRLQEERQAQTLREIGQALITSFNMEDLAETMIQNGPQIGIPRCFVFLYEGQGAPAERCKLILAYDEQGRIELEDADLVFDSNQLGPDGLLFSREPHGGRYTVVVEPLFTGPTQLGFTIFEVGPKDSSVYEALRGQLSGALRGVLLVQEVEDRTKALQEINYALQRRAIQLEASATVAQTITSIFDVDELFRRSVNLIRDQFGFYHAGIFLIDETGEWAVLQEATGEAGAQMKAMNHRLAVGETSMVGWTAFHHKPRIALYAAEDAVRYANPLLPYTRSEMTLPMMIGGRILGVLNVQSTDEAAFDEDDVRALQSMTNQVTIAIENARRVSSETRLLEATSPIYRVSRSLAQATTPIEVAECIITSVAETGADGCTVVEFEFSSTDSPEALLYRGVWRRDREVQFQPGMRLSISESPFPLEMVSTLWTVPDVSQADDLPQSARQVFVDTGVRSLANIPLRARGKVIGQVVVLRTTPGPFSDAAMRLYEALSDQAAVALERAQLWEEAQRRAQWEQMTRQMIDRIRRAMDMEKALQTTAQELSSALRVPHVSIELSLDTPQQDRTRQEASDASSQ
jgi:DNA-binding LacI/PurR family transcriptional regulator/GAF domain-containing protein